MLYGKQQILIVSNNEAKGAIKIQRVQTWHQFFRSVTCSTALDV